MARLCMEHAFYDTKAYLCRGDLKFLAFLCVHVDKPVLSAMIPLF